MKPQEIIDEAKKNLKAYGDFFSSFLDEARDDEKLANGDPWKDEDKAKRNGRPQEIINDTKITIRRTIEDYDQKRSTIKVKSDSPETDETTVNAIQGIIYDINNDSIGESIKDMAMSDMLTCGIGAYRWETEYKNDLSFEQKIKYKPIFDKFNIYLDIMNTKEIDLCDCMWGGENLYYDNDTFEAEWPDAEKKGFPDLTGQDNDGRICVSRYERIEMVNDTLISVVNPFTGKPLNILTSQLEKEENKQLIAHYREYGYDTKDDIFAWLTETGRILGDRDIERRTVKYYLLTDGEILDEGEIGGEYIPIVPMLGPRYILGGKVYFDSLIRQTKDPVRLNNFVISNYIEAMSADTIAPWITNYRKIKNHMNTWANANNKPTVALPYDDIELKDGSVDNSPPIKAPKGEVPAGWATLFQFTTEAKERTSGLPDSAAGLQGNEVSGSALQLRTDNGLANRSIFFKKRHFSDILLGKHMELAIPVYYDTEQTVSVAEESGQSKSAVINKEGHNQGEGEFKGKYIDIKNAKFKTFITVGPSFNSLKQETASKLGELLPYAGERYNDVIFPELVKYVDISNSNELYDNCMKVAPVEIQEQGEKDAKQLQTENAQLQQQIESLTQQTEEYEKVLMGEEQKVQSQQQIAKLKSETDIKKEILKQQAETQRERMSNQTDIKEAEIGAQAKINAEIIKTLQGINAKIDNITQIRTSEV